MARRDGFAGQRMQVLPGPRVKEALRAPVTAQLLVTDCGYFPVAADHYRRRERGASGAIVLVCTAGAGFVDVGLGRRPVRPGQVAVILPRLPHSYGADADNPWSLWWMHVRGIDVNPLLTTIDISQARPILRVRNPYRLVKLIEEALEHLEQGDSDLALAGAAGAAWHALTLLRSDRHSGTRDDPIRDIVDYLGETVGRRVPVAELAARARLSPTHFATLFRRATGLSVLQYQTRLAMNKARMLLDGTDLPVAAVAAQVGYSDPFYFSRQFRAVHGVNPTQYRQGEKG